MAFKFYSLEYIINIESVLYLTPKCINCKLNKLIEIDRYLQFWLFLIIHFQIVLWQVYNWLTNHHKRFISFIHKLGLDIIDSGQNRTICCE